MIYLVAMESWKNQHLGIEDDVHRIDTVSFIPVVFNCILIAVSSVHVSDGERRQTV